MGFTNKVTRIVGTVGFILTSFTALAFGSEPAATATVTIEKNSDLGIIKGVVRDEGGSPIAEASVAIFRNGTSKLLKQVTSNRDGSFLARIIPGTYSVLAVAQGFNPVTLFGV
ncbi:MAG: carboxypeptidase regulatory-like domain-containing protein, partial [Pyrinomonadaceae bacterium]